MGKATSDQREREAASELIDAAAEVSRVAIEVLSSGDILAHFPLAQVVVGGVKLISSIKDQILMKKLSRFFQPLVSVSEDDRREMLNKLNSDPDFKQNVGEHLIEMLDRVDGQRKPAMLGAVFAALAREQINIRMLRRLNYAIERLPIMEIAAIRDLNEFVLEQESAGPGIKLKKFPDRIALLACSNAGLLEPETLASGMSYKLNVVGKALLELELDRVK